MNCEWTAKINALYDGALDAPSAAQAEAHAAGCAECARELASLQRIGRFLKAGTAQADELALARVRKQLGGKRVARLIEPRVIRLAKWLTGAAAAIMFSCGAALLSTPAASNSASANVKNWDSWALSSSDEHIALINSGDATTTPSEDSKDEQP